MQQQDALTSALASARDALLILLLIALGAWLDTDAAAEREVANELALETARAQAAMAERERVRAELVPQVRRAYQQGLDEGGERERARLAQWQEPQP